MFGNSKSARHQWDLSRMKAKNLMESASAREKFPEKRA
jgi:hypothetical protein